MANAETKWIAVLACDLPFVTGDLIAMLAERCSDEFNAIVPRQQDARPPPLCALYHRERCLPIAEEMLFAGEFQLRKFLSLISTHYVDTAESKEVKYLQRETARNVGIYDEVAGSPGSLLTPGSRCTIF